MNQDEIKSYYLSFVDDQTNGFEDAVKKSIRNYSDIFLSYLIHYLLNHSATLDEIEYRKIFEMTKADESESKDIDFMLYVFSIEPYNAIKWTHYFESDDFFEPKRDYISTSELAEVIETEEYYNPLSGNDISKETFYNDLCTVFGVSDRLKRQIAILKSEAI